MSQMYSRKLKNKIIYRIDTEGVEILIQQKLDIGATQGWRLSLLGAML